MPVVDGRLSILQAVTNRSLDNYVIPAKAGIHFSTHSQWVPAFPETTLLFIRLGGQKALARSQLIVI